MENGKYETTESETEKEETRQGVQRTTSSEN